MNTEWIVSKDFSSGSVCGVCETHMNSLVQWLLMIRNFFQYLVNKIICLCVSRFSFNFTKYIECTADITVIYLKLAKIFFFIIKREISISQIKFK